MWLTKTDRGITDIFAENAVYTESWGPEYHGAEKIKFWFDECITRQDLLKWDIQQMIHTEDQTVVQWYFGYQNINEAPKAFDGVSVISWTADEKILTLKEYCCELRRYDPYKNGVVPQFENQ